MLYLCIVFAAKHLILLISQLSTLNTQLLSTSFNYQLLTFNYLLSTALHGPKQTRYNPKT